MLRPLIGRRRARRSRRRGAIAVALLASLLYVIVRPAYADGAVGSSTGNFLDFEVGGRPSGMGGAQVANAAGVTAQYWNPAALAGLDSRQIGAMHATWLQDLNYEWIGYAQPVSPKLGVGSISVAYFHLPSIDGVDDFGNPTGEFKVYDMAVTAGLAKSLGHGISVGANLKAIRQNLATVSAMGPAMDLGAMVTYRGTNFGAVAQNIGPGLSYSGSTSYPLPHQLRFGASRPVWGGRLLLASDYNMPSDYFNDLRIGAEFRAHPNISLRAGYRHLFGTSGDPGTGLSYGLGINFKQMNVDYSMTPSNDFDNVQRLSFGYSFGSGATEEKPAPKKPKPTKPAPPAAPTGPAVIAHSEPKAPAPKAAAPQAEAPKAVAIAPALPAPTPEATPAPREVAPPEIAPEAPPKPVDMEYAIVLPGFSSKESAQAEVKALELLGFKTKDAHIAQDTKRGGFTITLMRMKSKGKADEMASSLQRMSFRAMVDLAQK